MEGKEFFKEESGGGLATKARLWKIIKLRPKKTFLSSEII